MQELYESLEKGSIGLFESPTGGETRSRPCRVIPPYNVLKTSHALVAASLNGGFGIRHWQDAEHHLQCPAMVRRYSSCHAGSLRQGEHQQ